MLFVSIHARAWRATDALDLLRLCYSSFNSRPRVAGDTRARTPSTTSRSFNSRPRVAGDCKRPVLFRELYRFNSRPRVAGDGGHYTTCRMRSTVSIHARAWRATRQGRSMDCRRCFNSRPRVAGDVTMVFVTASTRCFNSRPRVAGDNRNLSSKYLGAVSIHARAWRATCPSYQCSK